MSQHDLFNKIPLRGDLTVIRRDSSTGTIINVWTKKNVITFGGTELLVKLMAPNAAFGGTVQLESQIKSMRFGRSNTTPNRSDTNLLNEAIVSGNPVRKQLLDANRVVGASGTVEFSATLGPGEGNGTTYREAGLFSRGTADDPLVATGSTMFSRQVFPDETKSGAVTLQFVWRISFTV